MNTNASDLRLIGGRLCLDFVNTCNRPAPGAFKEHLRDYGDFITWAQHCALLTNADAMQLRIVAADDPAQAAHTLTTARTLRETLYQLLHTRRPPSQDDLRVLNELLAAAPARTRLVVGATGVAWNNTVQCDKLDALLWPIAWSAADLLTSGEAALVHQCAGDGCSWLFLDTTPKQSRQWCSMEDCGNRMKVRRHYARKKQGSVTERQDDKMTG